MSAHLSYLAVLTLIAVLAGCAGDGPLAPGRPNRAPMASIDPAGGGGGAGEGPTQFFAWYWDPPPDGSAVARYEVQTQGPDGRWQTYSYAADPIVGILRDGNYRVRVRGRDAKERWGKWSPASKWLHPVRKDWLEVHREA